MPVDQIQQRKQVNPHDVDEVPVEAADLEWGVILRRKASLPCHPQKPGENAEADNHVQGMQSGHDEVEGKENLGVLRVCVLIGMAGDRHVLKAEGRAGHMMIDE